MMVAQPFAASSSFAEAAAFSQFDSSAQRKFPAKFRRVSGNFPATSRIAGIGIFARANSPP
jgi:hypothetical protein